MFLLLLMGLGAAVKAQVRIGGNTAPSVAAVLDLNAGNDNVANTGTGGLVLPRVDLKTNVMQLTTGVANQTGTMVYNVTTTLGQIGVYYWNGNTWVKASLPSTSLADSGLMLISNGTQIVLGSPAPRVMPVSPGVSSSNLGNITWIKTYSANVPVSASAVPAVLRINTPGATATDVCMHASGSQSCFFTPGSNYISMYCPFGTTNETMIVVCYRPSA